MKPAVSIDGRLLGAEYPCFMVAEAGVNHNGDLDLAKRLVDIAADAGADAVKFQTFTSSSLVVPDAPLADYQMKSPNAGSSQYEMLKALELGAEAHQVLADQCRRRGLLFMSTPFDEASADFLDELGVPVFKTPSPEITNLSLLAHIAAKGKPMIVSTGTANLGEVEAAVNAIKRSGNSQIVLLHCVSNYPADPSEANLRAMQTMATAFGVPVGFSDHTAGIEVALGAVALGACVIEKHFTTDCTLPGPDHIASMEPSELAALIKGIAIVSSALGDGRKEPTASEANIANTMRRSLVALNDIPAGTVLDESIIGARRPGSGLPPTMQPYLVGRRARRRIRAGEVLTLEMFE